MDDDILAVLACPKCRGPLKRASSGLACAPCRALYPIIDDIPVLLIEEALPLSDAPAGGDTPA